MRLQDDLNRLTLWSTTWSLPFNVKKCFVLSFPHGCGHAQFSNSYHLNNTPLSFKLVHNDLGVVLSSDLRWSDHYEYIMAKSYRVLGLLLRVFSSVHCPQAKRVLYITLVRSKLLYCSPIWRPHLLRDIKALENVQRRATKFILNNYVSNYRLRLLDLHLCSFNLTNVLLLWLGLDTRCVGVVG
jgi:hypothetical protein